MAELGVYVFDEVCCWRDTNLIGNDCDSVRDKTVRPVNYPHRELITLVVCDQDRGTTTLRYSGDQHRSTLSKAQERLRRLKPEGALVQAALSENVCRPSIIWPEASLSSATRVILTDTLPLLHRNGNLPGCFRVAHIFFGHFW